MILEHSQHSKSTMKVFLALMLAAIAMLASTPLAIAQSDGAASKPTAETIETFYLASTFQPSDASEIRFALQSVLPPNTPVSYNSAQNALIVRTTPDQMLLARKVIADLDRAKKAYRLTFTITESDSGKRIGTQHFALVLTSGQRTTLKQGSKVPVATGISNAQTQFTYLDVGINIDASIDDSSSGLRLKSKVEQSSIADSTAIADVREPIIRQNVLEGISFLSIGKPVVLGGLDVPGSTRHLDIEAVVEVVK